MKKEYLKISIDDFLNGSLTENNSLIDEEGFFSILKNSNLENQTSVSLPDYLVVGNLH